MLSVFLAGLLAIPGAQAQQPRNDTRRWYQAYADAQRNVQQKNWTAAIADIEAASRLGAPKPGRNILFYGDVYGNFIPDYYLGIAYLGLNRPDDADRAFERVRQAQLIAPRDNLYAEFTRQATTVKDLLAKQAATQLAAADTTPNPPPAIPTPLAPANADVTDQPIQQQSPIQQPTPDTGGPGGVAPPPAGAADAGRGAAPNATPPANPPPVRPTPPVRPPNTGPLSPAVLAAERSALVDFFTGQYQVAANKLSTLTAGPNASPRAYFYLACSRVALVFTGKADAATAIADARAQLALAGDTGQFALDKSLISPRIRLALGMQP